MTDLFSNQQDPIQNPSPGITLLKGLAAPFDLYKHIHRIQNQAPFRHITTPNGHETQIAMSNCGAYGWVSNLRGYAYVPKDPLSNKPWPPLPDDFLTLSAQACELAGIRPFTPNACLINRYEIGNGLGQHQDKDEANFDYPIVSISLGLSAVFQLFGQERGGHSLDIVLEDLDVLVIAPPARLFYHAIKPIKADILRPNLTQRFNLTLRKAK